MILQTCVVKLIVKQHVKESISPSPFLFAESKEFLFNELRCVLFLHKIKSNSKILQFGSMTMNKHKMISWVPKTSKPYQTNTSLLGKMLRHSDLFINSFQFLCFLRSSLYACSYIITLKRASVHVRPEHEKMHELSLYFHMSTLFNFG